jgi:glycosyltransferase involved in cell wall biosynthesis
LPAIYAREFLAAGHEVVVLTGFPNYPDGVIYPGFRQRWRWRQELDGIEVVRVRIYANHSRSAAGRILNYLSFALSATLFGRRALHGADAIWVYNSPATVALPLMVHSKRGRTPYFLHVQDLWPDSLIESGMLPSGRLGKLLSSSASRVVRLMERHAAVIGVISPGVRSVITRRNQEIDPLRVIFAPNPADERLFRPSARGHPGQKNSPFVIMYAGALGEVQGLRAVIDAVALVHKRGTAVEVRFVGDGIARIQLEERARELGLSNVSFLGRLPAARIP